MKRVIFSLLFVLITASIAFATEQSVLARITVYWRSEGQLRAAWNGARLRDGHCAVDPKKIPYGSQVVFPDATCIAVDTGPAVVSRKAARSCGRSASQRNAVVVDRFFENKQQALRWAKTHPQFMTVRVQSPTNRSGKDNMRLAANDSTAGMSVPDQPEKEAFKSWDSFAPTVRPDGSPVVSALFRYARRRT
jgi:3D (Asp-Asp-Asp) domain-containing protein